MLSYMYKRITTLYKLKQATLATVCQRHLFLFFMAAYNDITFYFNFFHFFSVSIFICRDHAMLDVMTRNLTFERCSMNSY